MRVDDQPSDLVRLIRDDGLFEKMRERQIGERELRRDPFGSSAAEIPASSSPARFGVALASSVFRSAKT
jgi:hypothetical protein